MSTEHENGGDESIDRDLVRRYRESSAALDERPSASARAAILAAAAREVQAKPTAADAPRLRRPGWPLAAAAVVMLSTLAVTLAIRTQEEMPQFGAPDPANSAAEKVAVSPAPPAPESSRRDEPARATQPAPLQELARSSENRQAATPSAAASSKLKREGDQSPTAPSEQKQTRSGTNAPPAAPPPAAAPLPKTFSADAAPPPVTESPLGGSPLRKAQGEINAGLQASSREQAASAAADARADAPRGSAPAPSVAQERQRGESAVIESATAWLERIIRLRRENRHSEADAELKLFRERYPHIQPPSEALSPNPAR